MKWDKQSRTALHRHPFYHDDMQWHIHHGRVRLEIRNRYTYGFSMSSRDLLYYFPGSTD